MNITNNAVGFPNTLSFEPNCNTSINLNQNSKSLSNEEEAEASDDNSTLINLKNFNINNLKEIRGFESNSSRINNLNNIKDSLIKGGKLNISNSAGNIINNNNPLSNKLFKDDFQIKNSPTQREKRKRNKFSSIFSDFFSSNSEKKNSSLDYNSFKDSAVNNSLQLEMSNNNNLNKKTSAAAFFNNKKFKQDEKKFSLIEEDNSKNNDDVHNNNNNKKLGESNNLNNENEISENENKLKLSHKEKIERQNTNSFSSASECNNKIDKQNYILESEINLSKPIAIKNILNAGSSSNNKEDSQENNYAKGSAKEKIKFSRSKIKDFIKEKILKNKSSSDFASKNNKSSNNDNDYKNLYENLKFNYSDFENDNIKNESLRGNAKKGNNKNKYPSNEKQNKNNNFVSEVDYETDPEDLRKIDEVVKREVNLHSPKSKEKSNAFNNKKSSFEDDISPNKINFNENKFTVQQVSNTKQNKSLNLIDVNVNIKQNKKYNNLVEEELDAEANSNTDEDNMSEANNDNNCSFNSSFDKKSSFISVKLNEADNKQNENEDSIITKINQLENNNKLENINSSSSKKRKSLELTNNKNINSNINKNLLEEFESKSISNNNNNNNFNNNNDNGNNYSINTSQFPKFDEIFGEKIETQTLKQKKTSPFGSFETFTLFKVIIKNGEDLRQEQFATQLINEFHQIFKLEKVDCWVNTYEILATGNNAGIIEVVPNSISLDQLKRKAKGINSLRHFFEVYYGPENGKIFKNAMKNFISSLAGYSLVCYFLQIKDRHNGNILIDDSGHLIHIDFGFMFTNAPGKGIKFEKAPFKLTKEFVDVMGGVNSKNFQKFRKLLWK